MRSSSLSSGASVHVEAWVVPLYNSIGDIISQGFSTFFQSRPRASTPLVVIGAFYSGGKYSSCCYFSEGQVCKTVLL